MKIDKSRPDANSRAGLVGRRRFLALGSALAGSAAVARASYAGEASPPNDAEWSQMLGPGVVDRPYGQPSRYVKDVIRRNVPWLTATPESSVSFTPLQDQPGIITATGLSSSAITAAAPPSIRRSTA